MAARERGRSPAARPFDNATTSTTSTTLRRKPHGPPSELRAAGGVVNGDRTLILRTSVRGASMSSASSMSSNVV